MNEFTFDDELGGFLLVKTKFGDIRIEQWTSGTSVRFFENYSKVYQIDNPTHIETNIEEKIAPRSLVVSMVLDE